MVFAGLASRSPTSSLKNCKQMTQTHSGSCLCGAVRFEVHGRFQRFYLCHCSHCRKDTGSAHAANLFSATATVEWLSGADGVATYTLPGTRHARTFCTTCGSALPHSEGRMLVVPAGSLDSPVEIKPNAHIHIASRADWDADLAAVPEIEGLPD